MKITAISISDRKGIRKKNIASAKLIANLGLENDAHGGEWHRQVSLLAQESIDSMRQKGLDVVAGNFAENITTEGIDLLKLKVGDHIALGETEIVISQLGKVCHHKCAIFHQAGDCVMPREGIFAVVKKGGIINVGDPIAPLPSHSPTAAVISSKANINEYGNTLATAMQLKWKPAFVRMDILNSAQDNIEEILQDLINLQRLDRIVVFDPDGLHHGSLPLSSIQDLCKIYTCRSVEEIASL